MKKSYPNYKHLKITAEDLEQKLDSQEKEILRKFETYVSTSAGFGRTQAIRRRLLQIRDIMEVPLYKITLDEVISFLSILNQSNRKSQNELKLTLKRFLKFQYSDWSREFKNLEVIKLRDEFDENRIKTRNLITNDELERLCRATTNYRDKAIVLCLYELGCRPEELTKLKWRDIKFREDGLAEVSLFSGKTKKARNILIKESVLVLKDWRQHYKFGEPRSDDLVFCTKNRDKIMKATTFSLLISRLGDNANLGRHIFPYIFRHSRLQELHVKEKLPEQVWKKFAGHRRNSNMLSVYTRVDEEDLHKCLLEDVYKVEELTKEQLTEIEKLKLEIEKIKLQRDNNLDEAIKLRLGKMFGKREKIVDVLEDSILLSNGGEIEIKHLPRLRKASQE